MPVANPRRSILKGLVVHRRGPGIAARRLSRFVLTRWTGGAVHVGMARHSVTDGGDSNRKKGNADRQPRRELPRAAEPAEIQCGIDGAYHEGGQGGDKQNNERINPFDRFEQAPTGHDDRPSSHRQLAY